MFLNSPLVNRLSRVTERAVCRLGQVWFRGKVQLMPHYTAVIPTTWSVDEAFAYMSDFSNARYWDPSVQSARRLEDGDLVLGTQFELTVRFGGRDQVLKYRVTDIERPTRVVFTSESATLLSQDTLTFQPRLEGCTMTYHAELRLKGVSALATPILAAMFRPIGNRARDSLQKILGEPRVAE
jgi:hypothetical protein